MYSYGEYQARGLLKTGRRMVDSSQMQQESQQLETLHGEDLGLLPKQALIFQDWKFGIDRGNELGLNEEEK